MPGGAYYEPKQVIDTLVLPMPMLAAAAAAATADGGSSNNELDWILSVVGDQIHIRVARRGQHNHHSSVVVHKKQKRPYDCLDDDDDDRKHQQLPNTATAAISSSSRTHWPKYRPPPPGGGLYMRVKIMNEIENGVRCEDLFKKYTNLNRKTLCSWVNKERRAQASAPAAAPCDDEQAPVVCGLDKTV